MGIINFFNTIKSFKIFESEIKKLLPKDSFLKIQKSLPKVKPYNRESLIHFLKLGCSFEDANKISQDIFEITKNTSCDVDTILNDTMFCLKLIGRCTLKNSFENVERHTAPNLGNYEY